ncbi:LptE family protein [Aquimarina brevivitae]|uniref:LptE family protein n=1 Tax=Aquimarina brevivitae TaxID=323412 RepID=UPI0010299098|nr:LptE family protein [Aquimarina brevivitae]
MKNFLASIVLLAVAVSIYSCGAYSFTGISVSPEVKTFQVNFFQNQAPIVRPGIDQRFTNELQDLIQDQTNLTLVTTNGDIVYEGEIVQYNVAPMTATSQSTAAQSRLTIAVNVRFYDSKDPKQDLEQRFSFFYDFDAARTENEIQQEALDEIYTRLTQDIFNATLARW